MSDQVEMLDDELDGDTDDSTEKPFEELDLAPEERRLVTQPYDIAVRQLSSDVADGKILLIEVPYQREYVWDDAKASRLIESLLLNVPIPVCYFAENTDGTWEVIDGLQRTHSIVRFLKGEFALRGLSVAKELNSKRFSDLPVRDQRRIETRTMRCVVVTEDSHPDIKFDVFERLNTGSVKLTPQELRNCIYRGQLNDDLRTLAAQDAFRKAIGRAKNPRMGDEEMILRYLALVEGFPGYKPPVTQFLNEYMRARRSAAIDPHLRTKFESTMRTIFDVLGGSGFRSRDEEGQLRGVNRALFDAVSISYSFADHAVCRTRASQLREGHEELLRSPTFLPLIGRATADRTRMHGRVRRYADMMSAAGISVDMSQIPAE